jgi:hypothetical protein
MSKADPEIVEAHRAKLVRDLDINIKILNVALSGFLQVSVLLNDLT